MLTATSSRNSGDGGFCRDDCSLGVAITSVSQWLGDASIYLADLEPQQVAALTEVLKEQLAQRSRDARRRGWEVE
jgi:hypothetical protein